MSSSTTPDILSPSVDKAVVPSDNIHAEELRFREKIKENRADILSYFQLIQYLESQESYAQVRDVYEEFHTTFPFYSPAWTLQLKGELARDEFETVEKILAQCLSGKLENNDLSLWSTYLDYIRRKNNLITGGQEARAIIVKAFQLVMQKCAVFEPKSSSFWNEYLSFLEQWKPFNKWEEQQRIDMLREFYKKMLCVPFDNLEKMWNRYTQWEQEVNSLTARKFIGELSAEYMKARSLYQEWLNITNGLKRASPINLRTANKKNIPQPGTSDMNIKQLQIWLEWIKWEKENKLMLSEDVLTERIHYVYKQGIQYMVFSAEMWYDYSMYISGNSDRQNILYTALLANPDSPSLTFKLSECYELDNDSESVSNCFDKCTQTLLAQYKNTTSNVDTSDDDKNPITEHEQDLVYRQREKLTFVFCVYMNTMKRISGLSSARSVFGKCRKLKRILTHDVYVENAYLEFQNQNDYKTAFKVLELGLKYFQNDGVYINKYLDFLIFLNKDSQIKTLFETSVEKVQDLIQLKAIYKKMISYESKFGNLNNVYSLEKRFFERFPQENLIEVFTNRYQIQNSNLLKKLELTYMYNEKEDSYLSSGKQNSDYGSSNINPSERKRSMEESGNNGNFSNKKFKRGSELPAEVLDLLSVIPKRQYFNTNLLDAQKLVNFLNDQVEIPATNGTKSG
ncbi:hypothetical protein SEUBUCD650_0M01980 [Saccharomyces eubayanus]|uniref:mRNA 3'-end-processing protein RNA14 n=1 Tax=Saccharomyces eubayanus TaxID=1080349 RepID=A0ABN8VF66_SACEU|nr:hypothetical protein SEUBUCD650_0M01980 [Saccharomyces eubayanus]